MVKKQSNLKKNTIEQLGTIVECRGRKWVVVPADNQDMICLRPLNGNEDQICGIYRPLGLEELSPADFPLPQSKNIQDHNAGQLLLDAARLSLRSGAGPFRCLGRLSLRPRPYQIVPLLMALKLPVTRLLIADDVGIGKTIEAGLIVRELLDRGEAKRLAVLCPPQLCDQWQKELKEKFHIDAVVIRSGTASRLERGLPGSGHHIFQYYPHIIVSLDYAKSANRLASFQVHCPDLVIVDEAHTCATSQSQKGQTQQRYELVRAIAQKEDRHLVLLTATPHSGIEAAFMSLLGLLKPEFEQWSLDYLTEEKRKVLANHLVQRRRIDVRHWLGDETPFPERKSEEKSYELSKEYGELFDLVYEFARNLVINIDEGMSYAQQKGRYWSALAIIRCVMSSPVAAVSTLERQANKSKSNKSNQKDGKEVNQEEVLDSDDFDDNLAESYVYDVTEREQVVDDVPIALIEQGTVSYSESNRKQFQMFVKLAKDLQGEKDYKLKKAIALVKELLKDGFHPIIWCRYIDTANYVAKELQAKLEGKKGSDVRVIAITGNQSEDERIIRLEQLMASSQRVMVATDCLSEGVNLQSHFTAAIHYDLPWNPNRLEQREGRIDRYGQTAPVVKCILLYGDDNPVDGSVLQVLIRKAVKIHKTLGVTVPVPMDSNNIQKTIFQSLFEYERVGKQLTIFDLMSDQSSPMAEIHKEWDRAVDKEKENRTRFAQRAIKPADVQAELIESDQILGTEKDVERFVQSACEKLGTSLIKTKYGWHLANIPKCVESVLGNKPRKITFYSPPGEGIEYIGRNHLLVEGLARNLWELALTDRTDDATEIPPACRCGFTVTNSVSYVTVILLLRLRHLLEGSGRNQAMVRPLLAEECLVRGFTGVIGDHEWLSPEESLRLFMECVPTGDYPLERRKLTLDKILKNLDDLHEDLKAIALERGEVLAGSHRRVRAMTKETPVKVVPQLPMDILGVYILQPG